MFLDKVVDMPVIVNDRVLHSGGATATVHRLFMWTFSCATELGVSAGYGGDEGFFGGFSAFFALLRVVPELSASFRSPR